MASYLILTPPGAPNRSEVSDRYRDGTRFIRDGFSWKALLFPTLWMLFHRLWLYAVAAFLLQGFALELMRQPGFFAAGAALLLGVHVLAALEGPHAISDRLVGRGWKVGDLVSARDLATAEEIHFSRVEQEPSQDIHPNNWDIPATNTNTSRPGPSFGLPGYDGGR
ncbi:MULTISPECIES: DUF2628 domain-containing protein [unclassified Rhizobium]|uniref:DUF2628 domain-containing protein n=1 Tax=unclassified Rhizobium TaxID=2613769 RepID=UPI000EA9F7F0|nr:MULTISPECIES: DUF2628 domain-containing protein [unclassified Rhizobium]AYG64603.1 DUF2628 domain-containing protein [Rhizobium sp. CCGE531]AYG71085.1 DUF2628 domain-containing protein [Rhizobium sp. CCGE532]